MRIGIVSTYPPIECGIATYAKYLTDALKQKGNEIYVFSQYGAKGDYVFGTYSSQGRDIATNLFLMASKMTPDVLHIQHEFGLYGQPKGIQIIELILRCRVAGLPVVTTFHTVSSKLTKEEEIVLKVIVQESEAIIVHGQDHKVVLSDYFGNAEKVHVIPHGVREVELVPMAQEKLGVSGKKVVLLCGYMSKTKRFDRVVEVFPEVASAVDEAVLLVACKSRGVDKPQYEKDLYKMMDKSPVSDKIDIIYGQFPQPVFDTIISAADVVVLPYELGAQSGIMAQCFAFRKPTVVSDLKAFEDCMLTSGGGLTAKSDTELASHIIRILKDDEFRHSLEENIAQFVKTTASWSIVADQHKVVYEECMRRPTARARYFG